MRFKLLALFFVFSLSADPWGKDASLAYLSPRCSKSCQTNVGVSLSNLLIQFHQEFISPADGPRSHYIPSSSQYAKEAINKYGFFQGWMLACDRLLRENDEEWVYKEIMSPEGVLLKWDPVP